MLVAYFLLLIGAVAARATEAPTVFSILRNGIELGRHEMSFTRERELFRVNGPTDMSKTEFLLGR